MRGTLLLAAGVLAAAIPAAAQNHGQTISIAVYAPPGVKSSPAPPSSPAPAPVQPMFIARMPRPTALPVLNNYRRQDPFRFAPSIESDSIVSMDGIVGRNDTDFAAERFFPMIAPAKGKIELSGYYGLRSMENVLMGLPGGGVLPAWSVTRQAHLAVSTPYADVSYGVTMRFHFHHDDDGSLHAAGFHCLGKLIGKGQSCRILSY
jgi:hypothetical protein